MEQNGEKANFHFWDAVCIIIFGKTADECRQELIASGDEIKVFPACVDQLLGKTWVVRFKHRIQMHQSYALDFSEQEHHIQSVISTLGLQSSEYDPGNVAFVTSAKRTSDQQGSSQFDSDDFTTYELSTNKHIKVE
uniref:Replication factor A C-terminal domain-containing protein n=1 Tax=Glycine max TaxID=3847 RepID=A0A0R0EJ78_SOYBN